MKLAVADITSLSVEAGLPSGMVNSGIIGSFARASGLLEFDFLLKAIEEEFSAKRPKENARAALLAYERTVLGG
jgi:Pyruvate/2-oxoacid:ferredoxin oxidoreductase gamma subunit